MPSYTVTAACARCSDPLSLEIPPAAGREIVELHYRLAYLRLFPAYYRCRSCGSTTPRRVDSVVRWPDVDPDSDAFFELAATLPLPSLEPAVAAAVAATRTRLRSLSLSPTPERSP